MTVADACTAAYNDVYNAAVRCRFQPPPRRVVHLEAGHLMNDDRKYVRVYYSIQDDPKFDRVRESPALLGTWLRLLMAADAVWPSSADLPRSLQASHVRLLMECGLVDELPGHRFRIHGLDSERNARRNAASNAAAKRWHSNGNADAMPSKAEPSKAEQRLNEDVDLASESRPRHLSAVVEPR